MSARETEAMVDSMLRDSPLPDTERSDEKLPEDGGSNKLPKEEEGDGEKLPEGGDGRLPEEAPTGKLVPSCTEKVLFVCSYFNAAYLSSRFPKSREYCGDDSRCAREGYL